MKKIYILLSLILVLSFSACDRYPLDVLRSPSVNQTTAWGSSWPIFVDTVQTRGSFAPKLFTNWVEIGVGGLDMKSREKMYQGQHSICIMWTGAPNAEYNSPDVMQTGYVGFSLLSRQRADGTLGYDLTPGNYTKLTFYAMGTLNQNVALKVETGNEGTPKFIKLVGATGEALSSSSWTKYTLNITDQTRMDRVENMVVISLVNTTPGIQTNGGRVYIADIRLTQ